MTLIYAIFQEIPNDIGLLFSFEKLNVMHELVINYPF